MRESCAKENSAMGSLVFSSPVGNLQLEVESNFLTGLHFLASTDKPDTLRSLDDIAISLDPVPPANQAETTLLAEAKAQILAYFDGKLKNFDLPLRPAGTEFMQKVWAELIKIPYGHTASYGDIAVRVHNPKASRAVGMANNRNPIAIIIPCHRVIGGSGKLTGYAGGLDVKAKLLQLEKQNNFR